MRERVFHRIQPSGTCHIRKTKRPPKIETERESVPRRAFKEAKRERNEKKNQKQKGGDLKEAERISGFFQVSPSPMSAVRPNSSPRRRRAARRRSGALLLSSFSSIAAERERGRGRETDSHLHLDALLPNAEKVRTTRPKGSEGERGESA